MTDPYTRPTPPDALEVERLSVVMAAAIGVAWGKASAEQARHFRVMANAALLHGDLTSHAATLRKFKAALGASVEAQRDAAAALDGPDAKEPLIQALYAGATAVSGILATLDGIDVADEDGKEAFDG